MSSSLAKTIFAKAKPYGQRTAIKTSRQEFSYQQLREIVVRHAHRLRSQGVSQSSLIAIDADHIISNIALALASSLIGCRWVHCSKAAFENEALEITHFVCDTSKPYPFAPNVLRLDPSWNAAPTVRVDLNSFSGYASPKSIWSIGQSSGTTGMAKFMPISAAASEARMDYPFDTPEGEPIRGVSLAHPLSAIGLYAILRFFMRGGTLMLDMNFDFLSNAGVNVVVGSPVQLDKLRRNSTKDGNVKIRSAVVTGGATSPALFEGLLRRFEIVRNAYGSTEAGLMSSRIIDQATIADRSAGLPAPGAKIQIVDSGDISLPANEEGIVRLQTPGQVHEYIGEPETTAETFRHGWFYPGDLGYLDEAGELHVTGRVKDHLNLGGVKLNAELMDQLIQVTPGVRDGICFAQSEFGATNELAILLMLEPNADQDGVIAHMRDSILETFGPARLPKRIYVGSTVPRNANGKVMRHLGSDAVQGLIPIT